MPLQTSTLWVLYIYRKYTAAATTWPGHLVSYFTIIFIYNSQREYNSLLQRTFVTPKYYDPCSSPNSLLTNQGKRRQGQGHDDVTMTTPSYYSVAYINIYLDHNMVWPKKGYYVSLHHILTFSWTNDGIPTIALIH